MHVVVNINYCIELTSILKWNKNGRSENGTSLKKCQKENSDVNEQHLGIMVFDNFKHLVASLTSIHIRGS